MKMIKKSLLKILEEVASGRRQKGTTAAGPLALTSAKKKQKGGAQRSRSKTPESLVSQSEISLVTKFLAIVNTHIKTTNFNGFQDSMLLLAFLNEMGLDPSSAGYLAEHMHLSKS